MAMRTQQSLACWSGSLHAHFSGLMFTKHTTTADKKMACLAVYNGPYA